MKITRTLLLVLIAAISLGMMTVTVQAQDAPAAPAAPATVDAPATPATPATPAVPDGVPVLTEGDRSGGDTAGKEADGKDADGKKKADPVKTEEPPAGNPMFNPQMLFLIGAMVLFFVFMGRNKRKTEKKRKDMIAALKKGDKVTTIGGIVGSVLEVRDDEVTIKIDENSNTRMRFARWAVRGVGSDAKTEEPEGKK